MDIRIVNTCNNDCLYCLESSLRGKDKYINKQEVISLVEKNADNHVTFYGGNPLLHPDLIEILRSISEQGILNIGLLSNTYTLSQEKIDILKQSGLNNFGFYFYSFTESIHDLYSGGSLKLSELCKNIQILQKSGIYLKCIIHIHAGNIGSISKNIYFLNKKFGIQNFEFINYLIVERAEKFKQSLYYDINEYRIEIDKIFQQIKQLNISVKFVRFDKDFFGDYQAFKK